MQLLQLVQDRGLGLADDAPAVTLPIRTTRQLRLADPAAGTVPVPLRVGARAPVVEGDSVFAASAPASHDGRLHRGVTNGCD